MSIMPVLDQLVEAHAGVTTAQDVLDALASNDEITGEQAKTAETLRDEAIELSRSIESFTLYVAAYRHKAQESKA